MSTKMLCIFDGLGLVPFGPNNAVSLANMPNFRRVLSQYPWITLDADGESVGQEAGLAGNSEVGHTNIGGLKLVKQLSLQITESAARGYATLSDDQLFDPGQLLAQKFASQAKTVHLVGLFSTASVHSDFRHWAGAIMASERAGVEKIVLHIISDGRDSDRQSLVATWQHFRQTFAKTLDPIADKLSLGSLGGRFYLMDRDKNYGRNWQGLQVALSPQLWSGSKDQIQEVLSQKQAQVDWLEPEVSFSQTDLGQVEQHLSQLSQQSYAQENYDETIVPLSLSNDDLIAQKDTVWLINFRTDRMRQTVQLLTELNQQLNWGLTILATNDYGAGCEEYLTSELTDLDLAKQNVYYPIFKFQPVQYTLAERISEMHKTQLHIAETEKYNHVTFFLNGGQDVSFEGEEHKLIPSNKVKSHAEIPEMKTKEVADYILENYSRFDYIVVNFACPDMIGHTGDISASVRTLEFLDQHFGRILEKVEAGEIDLVLIADHGNIEVVGEVEANGQKYVDTAHNPNPVPCVFVKKDFRFEPFYESLEGVKQKYGLDIDLELIKSEVARRVDINLMGQGKWLTKEQIPTPKIPLWYSGAFLLGV